MTTYDHMLIDVRNCAYRALYASLSDKEFTEKKKSPIVILFRFISSYINRFKPNNVHFFWDCPKEKVWRRQVYPIYKNGRDTTHQGKYDREVVDELLNRTLEDLYEMIPYLNSRSYSVEKQEADDLIYAFCKQNYGHKMIIISSDKDFEQIPYRHKGIDLFNPLDKRKRLYESTTICPVEIKAFAGEPGDNIIGYNQIGPVRAKAIIQDYKKRKDFFKTHDDEIYLINKLLIDLSLNPDLLLNLAHICDVMALNIKYDSKALHDVIKDRKIKGLSVEFQRLLSPFKNLGG